MKAKHSGRHNVKKVDDDVPLRILFKPRSSIKIDVEIGVFG
jgi:hypothetical protein